MSNHSSYSMAIKLKGVILALSIVQLAGDTFALSIEVLVDIIFVLLLKKPYASGRASRYHLCSINRSYKSRSTSQLLVAY